MYNYFLLGVGLLLALGTWRLLRIGRRDPRLPPGPPTVPILGNAHQIPLTGLGKKFHEWAREYGKIYSLKVFDSNMIVLADRKAIHQLMDKKGSIYSERPYLAVPTFMSRGCHMTFEQATPEWREKRSVITRNLNPQNLDKKHFRVQEAESILFMNNLVHHPKQAFDYARLYASSVAAILVWGFRAKNFESFFYKDFYDFVDQWLGATEPGANPPVEQLPWLWYLPGAWKKRAYHVRGLMDTTWSKARQMVEERRQKGDMRDSVICTAALASFNYGYSNNVISGSFGQPTFLAKFLTRPDASSIIDAIVSGFFGCALIGAFLQAWIAQRWGRKRSTAVAAVFLLIGNALQAGAVHIAMFVVGRYITGFGAGMVISNTPVYLSEIAPAHSRGLLVGLQGNFIVMGYILSSCAALGFHFVNESIQWRLNFIIATAVAVALLASLVGLPESPRWLIEHGRPQEARGILDSIHTTRDDPEGKVAHAEYHQIVAQVEVDRSLPSGWLHIIRIPSLRKRMICTLLVWSMRQSTGITVLANLTPTLFGNLGYSPVLQLVLSLVWTVCLFIGCFFNIYLIDRIGRVPLIVSQLPVDSAWLYCWLRKQGAAISYLGFYVCSIWATAPAAQAFASIGWKYYMVFIVVTVVLTIPCMFYLPETAGLSLEDLGAKFGDTVALDFEHALEEELKGTGSAHVESDVSEINDESKHA